MNTDKIMEIMAQALDNQLRDREPKETRETLERLIQEGNSEDEAKTKILLVLTEEMFEVFRNKKEFNQQAYVDKLKELK